MKMTECEGMHLRSRRFIGAWGGFGFALALAALGMVEGVLPVWPARGADSAGSTQQEEVALPRIAPTSPDAALATLRVASGLRVELMAAEPMVLDPIAMAFDARGRLYVVEMRDYSERRPERLGRVRLLEDTDGDGRFDRATVFLDDLPWPTAVTCYDGGVFVGCTPEVLFARDDDGDGRADLREVVFRGFASDYAPYETNRLNVQALMNSLQWGPDNRIYGATSMSAGRVGVVDTPFTRAWRKGRDADAASGGRAIEPLELRGRDFSFDPRSLELRAETGGGQHGMSFDPGGERYLCSNSDHFQWIRYPLWLIPDSSSGEWPQARLSIASDGAAAPVYRISPEEPWRVLRTQWRVTGIVPGMIEGGGRPSGYFTGATGVTMYRGDAMGSDFGGDAFVADCGSNLVHRKRVRMSGNGIDRVGDRWGEEGVEFLASTDNWFRPVQMASGPDGGLWIADMYREVIEHPWSLPPGIKEQLDLNSGNDRGRLWRVVAEDWAGRPANEQNLEAKTSIELVRTLSHANGWHRETAARLLYERGAGNSESLVALRQLAGQGGDLVGRVGALWLLESLKQLDEATWRSCLSSEFSGLRRQAMRVLGERHWRWQTSFERDGEGPSLVAEGEASRWREQVIGQVNQETEVEVLWEAALVSARFPAEDRLRISERLIRHSNELVATTAVAAVGDQAGELWRSLNASSTKSVGGVPSDVDAVLPVLLSAVGRGGDAATIEAVAAWLGSVPESEAIWEWLNRFWEGGLAHGWARGTPVAAKPLDRWTVLAREKLAGFEAGTGDLSVSELRPQSAKEAYVAGAIRWLGHRSTREILDRLPTLLTRGVSGTVESAALDVFRRHFDRGTAVRLRSELATLDAGLRDRLTDLMLQRDDGVAVLLDALEAGELRPQHLNARVVARLREWREPVLRRRAQDILGEPPENRREVLKKYLAAVTLEGDVERGRARFQEKCVDCHAFRGEGRVLGPDLAASAANGAETLLVAIVDPNRDVSPSFGVVLAELKDGEQVTGLLMGETGDEVRLASGGGVTFQVKRSDILQMTHTGRSLMPEGLEEGWRPADLADLLAFLLQR